jgi:transcriptional regulator with PAS, ATPase and Fis domain
MPAEMFEAELFGSERGAYTGAEKAREGLAGATKDGTLFLDEIGEVPLPLQAKLLRFLEAREYRSLGSTVTKKFAGRVVAATNRLLPDEVAAGRFRQDLLYRLDSFTVHLPPLRERREEIPALAERLLNQLAVKYGRKAPKLQPEDGEALRHYEYPGNIRELRNLLERSLLRTPPDVAWLALDAAWLKQARPAALATPAAAPVSPAVSAAPPTVVPTEAPAPVAPARELPPLEAQEYEMVRRALVETNGGIRRAAAKLGISHQALLRRLQKWPELRPAGE